MFTRTTLLSNNRPLYFKWSKFVCSLSILVSKTCIGTTGFQSYLHSFWYKLKQWNCTKNFDYFEHSLHATRETFWVKILCFLSKVLNRENPYRNNLNQNDRQPLVQSIHTLYLLVFKELWTVVVARPVSFTELTLSLLSCLTCFTGVIGFLNFQNERKRKSQSLIFYQKNTSKHNKAFEGFRYLHCDHEVSQVITQSITWHEHLTKGHMINQMHTLLKMFTREHVTQMSLGINN